MRRVEGVCRTDHVCRRASPIVTYLKPCWSRIKSPFRIQTFLLISDWSTRVLCKSLFLVHVESSFIPRWSFDSGFVLVSPRTAPPPPPQRNSRVLLSIDGKFVTGLMYEDLPIPPESVKNWANTNWTTDLSRSRVVY